MISWQPYDSSFLACLVSPHSNGMTFKIKVKSKWGSQKMWLSLFSIKTACISETVSDTAKVAKIATHIRAFD